MFRGSLAFGFALLLFVGQLFLIRPQEVLVVDLFGDLTDAALLLALGLFLIVGLGLEGLWLRL